MNHKYFNTFFAPDPFPGMTDAGSVIIGKDSTDDGSDVSSSESNEAVKPKSRREYFLSGIAGNENPVNPKTRQEYFLSGVAGNENPINPKSREERMMSEIAQGGGSGGGELKVVYESYIDEEAEGDVRLIRCDHTHTEIMSALDAGKRVTADFVDGLHEYGNLIVTSNMDVIVAMDITYSAGTCTIGVLAHDSDDIIIKAGVVDLFA